MLKSISSAQKLSERNNEARHELLRNQIAKLETTNLELESKLRESNSSLVLLISKGFAHIFSGAGDSPRFV